MQTNRAWTGCQLVTPTQNVERQVSRNRIAGQRTLLNRRDDVRLRTGRPAENGSADSWFKGVRESGWVGLVGRSYDWFMHLKIAKFPDFDTSRNAESPESEARKNAAWIKPLTAAEFEVRSHEFGIRWAFAQTKARCP